MSRVHLDHNATTPLRPEARAELLRATDALAGNPSSVHASGRAAGDSSSANKLATRGIRPKAAISPNSSPRPKLTVRCRFRIRGTSCKKIGTYD